MTNFTQQVQKSRENLRNLFPETPLQYSQYLSDIYQANIYLKREDLTPVRSYKIRGAFNFMSKYFEKLNPDEISQTTFVCASAGNHAQGFAFSCAYFKVHGTIFMPITTPKQKIIKTEMFGGKFVKIQLIGDTFDDSSTAAQEFCKQQKAVFVPPFDHPQIIQGQATIAAEILDQISDKKIDKLLMPVGGGGLSAGLSSFFKENSPDSELYFVEPAGAPSLTESLKAKKLIELDKIDSFVDGAAVKKIGENNFEILRENVKNEVILVPENRLCSTMLDFLFHEGIILEPAGGLSIDALKSFNKDDLKNKNIVCVISGSNFDFERLPDVKERSMKYEGTKKYFILRLPQRPGALKEFLGCLGDEDDITRFEYLKKSAKNFGSVLLGIETKKPKNFKELYQKMTNIGFEFEDVTNNEIFADFVI
jgi:threonine dehydratase